MCRAEASCPARMTKAAFQTTCPHNSYSVLMEVDKLAMCMVAGWLLAQCYSKIRFLCQPRDPCDSQDPAQGTTSRTLEGFLVS